MIYKGFMMHSDEVEKGHDDAPDARVCMRWHNCAAKRDGAVHPDMDYDMRYSLMKLTFYRGWRQSLSCRPYREKP